MVILKSKTLMWMVSEILIFTDVAFSKKKKKKPIVRMPLCRWQVPLKRTLMLLIQKDWSRGDPLSLEEIFKNLIFQRARLVIEISMDMYIDVHRIMDIHRSNSYGQRKFNFQCPSNDEQWYPHAPLGLSYRSIFVGTVLITNIHQWASTVRWILLFWWWTLPNIPKNLLSV